MLFKGRVSSTHITPDPDFLLILRKGLSAPIHPKSHYDLKPVTSTKQLISLVS